MKRMIICMLALVLCLSVLFVTSCEGNNVGTTTTTTTKPQGDTPGTGTTTTDPQGGTTSTTPKPDDPVPPADEKHEKYPNTMAIIDVINEIVKELKAMDMPEIPDGEEIQLPTLSVDNITSTAGFATMLDGFEGIYFDGSKALFIPMPDGGEYAGIYYVLDGMMIYEVYCLDSTDIENNTMVLSATDLSDIFGQLGGAAPFYEVVTMPDLSELPDDISTLLTDEQLAAIEKAITEFPALSDEYKEDLGNGKYKIKREYLNDVITYVCTVAGEPETAEEILGMLSAFVINIEVTEQDGAVSAVDLEVLMGEMVKGDLHIGEDKFELSVLVDVPASMADGTAVKMELYALVSEAESKLEFSMGDGADKIELETAVTADKLSAELLMLVEGVDIFMNCECELDENGLPKKVTGRIDADISQEGTDIDMDITFEFDPNKAAVVGEDFITVDAVLGIDPSTTVDMGFTISLKDENTITATFELANFTGESESVSADINIGDEVNIPAIWEIVDLAKLYEDQQPAWDYE